MGRAAMDRVARLLLAQMVKDPGVDVAALAARAGVAEGVARQRLEALRESGVLRGMRAQVDRAKLGRPHEMLVTGAPSVRTDVAALQRLCGEAGVTRVFTLASRSSVAFTLCGSDVASLEAQAQALARGAGLEEPRCTLIVNTLLDDEGQALAGLLPDGPATA